MTNSDRPKTENLTAIAPGAADQPRYGIYYTLAPEHPLTIAARTWLGCNALIVRSQFALKTGAALKTVM